MANKLTHKAAPDVIDLIQTIDKSAGRNISWDEAWPVLAAASDLEFDIFYSNGKQQTEVTIFKGDSEIQSFAFDDVFNKEENEFDFDKIYRRVIEFCIRNKYIKTPKGMKVKYKETAKSIKAKAVTKSIETEIVEETPVDVYKKKYEGLSVDKLKNKKCGLYQKIRKVKSTGKSTDELDNELEYLKKLLKTRK